MTTICKDADFRMRRFAAGDHAELEGSTRPSGESVDGETDGRRPRSSIHSDRARRHTVVARGRAARRFRFGCLAIAALSLAASAGCQQLPSWTVWKPLWRSQTPESTDTADDFTPSVDTPMIGDYVTFAGLNLVTLEGVGLVVGLDGTGGDPPPSAYRTAMLDEMKRRGVRNPNAILRSPHTALVIVRAYLPPMIRKGERFDVEVRLPENSNATSLAGGRLLETYLSEQAVVPGRGVLKGHIFAKAKGPILVSAGLGDAQSLAGVLRRGRILGGGISLKQRDLSIYLRNDFRSVRNSKRIADRIGQRFHAYDRYGQKIPLAEAKTDQLIVLRVPTRYKDNFPRYLEVIRNIAFRESPVARRVRIERLKQDLMRGETAERSAIQLEAIGHEALPILKAALRSPDPEVRFHAATALAYLEDPSGLQELAQAARNERAFRIFALAAMATVDEPESRLLLRELTNAQRLPSGEWYDSAELRYGAFRALWTLDPRDPFLNGEKLNDEFWLHVLPTEGPPIVHLTHRMRAEIVLFGGDQVLRTPIAVRAGNHILVTAPAASDRIVVSRYQVGMPDERREVSTRLADVIRACAEVGATYPDVVQMLIQAKYQHNLTGRLEIDALPKAGRVYVRHRPNRAQKAPVGRPVLTPNMFDNHAGPAFQDHGDGPNTPAEPSGDSVGPEPGTRGSGSSAGGDATRDETAPDAAAADPFVGKSPERVSERSPRTAPDGTVGRASLVGGELD
ncbi:MAG: hypothetical protein D6725_16400 [Planctomycetota bacterium]|nr:MAG: hypothetical protein D6725_16400 [Planctomycetota bacterium]